jgi:hypothetical protein
MTKGHQGPLGIPCIITSSLLVTELRLFFIPQTLVHESTSKKVNEMLSFWCQLFRTEPRKVFPATSNTSSAKWPGHCP